MFVEIQEGRATFTYLGDEYVRAMLKNQPRVVYLLAFTPCRDVGSASEKVRAITQLPQNRSPVNPRKAKGGIFSSKSESRRIVTAGKLPLEFLFLKRLERRKRLLAAKLRSAIIAFSFTAAREIVAAQMRGNSRWKPITIQRPSCQSGSFRKPRSL